MHASRKVYQRTRDHRNPRQWDLVRIVEMINYRTVRVSVGWMDSAESTKRHLDGVLEEGASSGWVLEQVVPYVLNGNTESLLVIQKRDSTVAFDMP